MQEVLSCAYRIWFLGICDRVWVVMGYTIAFDFAGNCDRFLGLDEDAIAFGFVEKCDRV
jgi:hypothetical protein